MAAALVLVSASCGSSAKKSAAPTTTTTLRVATSTSTATASTTVPRAWTTTLSGSSYLSVYPFADVAQAQEWQRAHEAGGHQPWHLDAAMTAESFARFLGGSGQIDEAIAVRSDVSGAHVALGCHNPNGVPVTADTVHLVRLGAGNDRPWEVVGDEQSAGFTFTTPAYGANASSPVQVGGSITGVDENIRVRAWVLSRGGPVGDRCCLPAGGESSPSSTSVIFSKTSDPVLVIAATTGGTSKPSSTLRSPRCGTRRDDHAFRVGFEAAPTLRLGRADALSRLWCRVASGQ